MITNTTATKNLLLWSNAHAITLLLASLFLAANLLPIQILPTSAGISFLLLLYVCRSEWTPAGQFGWANRITLLRLLLVIMITVVHAAPAVIMLLALLILVLDSLDGWLARKLTLCSEFGEYFDKETDAFFILSLCWLLYLQQRFPAWILLPGLLRYGFVLFLLLARPPAYKEPQTHLGKFIFGFTVGSLILSFSDYPEIYQPLAILMVLLLCYSFAETVWRIYRD